MSSEGAISVTVEEYRADPKKYIKMSIGRTQVHVMSGDQTLIILGTGPIDPPTQEELDKWAAYEAELVNEPDPGRCEWFD